MQAAKADLTIWLCRDRGARRIHFPWPLVLGMRFCDLAPAGIGDAILRRMHFHIRAP